MIKPDYTQNSIVNLMSSLAHGMSFTANGYVETPQLPSQELNKYDNIIFLLIDGLGVHNLNHYANESVIAQNKRGELTSVFPSTTSAAITSLATAVAPQQHANTGWFIYLREIATTTAILPFVPRVGGEKLSKLGLTVDQFVDTPPFYSQLDRQAYVINKQYLVDSDYSIAITKGAKRIGYDGLDEFYQRIVETAEENTEKKYIYAYWPEYDGLCHTFGVQHHKTEQHFRAIDKGFSDMLERLRGSNSMVVLTADHGLIDTSADKVFYLEDFPEIKDCLRLPLCGEPRACFCYLKPGREDEFTSLVSDQLSQVCDAIPVTKMIEENFFGLGESHPELVNRLGDYILLVKDNYVIKDRLLGEKDFSQIGVHGGVSKQEMMVPLIVATP